MYVVGLTNYNSNNNTNTNTYIHTDMEYAKHTIPINQMSMILTTLI